MTNKRKPLTINKLCTEKAADLRLVESLVRFFRGDKEKQIWLLSGYLWWREVGHNYSVWESIDRVIYCEIRPIWMKPIWLLQIKWYQWQGRRLEKKFWKDIDKKI